MQHDITHVQQIDDLTCVSACLAMALNLPMEQVLEEFHTRYAKRELTIYQYLRNRGVYFDRLPAEYYFDGPRIFLVSVPSLNFPARMHMILIDDREDEFVVYDPQKGREDRLYYDFKPDGELPAMCRNIESYSIDYAI